MGKKTATSAAGSSAADTATSRKRQRSQRDRRNILAKTERFMIDKVYGRLPPVIIETQRLNGRLIAEEVELRYQSGNIGASAGEQILKDYGAIANPFTHMTVAAMAKAPSETFADALGRATAKCNKTRDCSLLYNHLQYCDKLEPAESRCGACCANASLRGSAEPWTLKCTSSLII